MWLLFILNPVYLSTNSQYDSGNLPAQLPTPPLTFPHKEKVSVYYVGFIVEVGMDTYSLQQF